MTVLVLAALTSLFLTGLFIQLARRFGWGKPVRAGGPVSHLAKAGTPTMGGAAFLLAALLMWALLGRHEGSVGLALVLLTLAAAALGLLDDLTSLRRKRLIAERQAGEARGEPADNQVEASTGVLARYRLLGQTAIALGFAYWAVQHGAAGFGVAWLDLLLFAFVIVGSINAFNFTDGLDGLAAGVTAIVLLFFLASPFAAALLGGLLGFFWYNAHPARLIMGGVGSEALGAAVAGLAILSGEIFLLPLVALIPVLEVLSVIVQVAYFRATGGRRLLRMSPLHHHFELSGWSETRVVQRFWLVTAICVAAAAALSGGLPR